MNYGQYQSSKRKAAELLRSIVYLRQEFSKLYPIPPEFLMVARGGDHVKIYESAIEHLHYDFLIKDSSIFQFDFSDAGGQAKARYAYYQYPYQGQTYDEFLKKEGYTYEEEGDRLREPYEQYQAEAPDLPHPISFRYDLAFNSYVQCVHGASHIHVGMRNSIRIPVNKILTPFAFVVFVMRNVYPKDWKTFSMGPNFASVITAVKTSSRALPLDFFSVLDANDLHLT